VIGVAGQTVGCKQKLPLQLPRSNQGYFPLPVAFGKHTDALSLVLIVFRAALDGLHPVSDWSATTLAGIGTIRPLPPSRHIITSRAQVVFGLTNSWHSRTVPLQSPDSVNEAHPVDRA